jgi:hypothetical protein
MLGAPHVFYLRRAAHGAGRQTPLAAEVRPVVLPHCSGGTMKLHLKQAKLERPVAKYISASSRVE